MACVVSQTEVDVVTKDIVENFSDTTLATIEDACKISRESKTKRYSSAKALLKACLSD